MKESSAPTVLEIVQCPLSIDELEDLNDSDSEFLKTFDKAWSDFLEDRVGRLPRGERLDNIESLKSKINDTESAKVQVENELQDQLEFFRKGRQEIEEVCDTQIRAEQQKQRAIHQELLQQLELSKHVEATQKETIPWFNFLEELNNLVETNDDDDESRNDNEATDEDDDNSLQQAPRPSARARMLSQFANDCPPSKMRETQIDHLILSTHANMLRKEIQRLECLSSVQQFTANFLAKHNVWSLLRDVTKEDEITVSTNPTASTNSTNEPKAE